MISAVLYDLLIRYHMITLVGGTARKGIILYSGGEYGSISMMESLYLI